MTSSWWLARTARGASGHTGVAVVRVPEGCRAVVEVELGARVTVGRAGLAEGQEQLAIRRGEREVHRRRGRGRQDGVACPVATAVEVRRTHDARAGRIGLDPRCVQRAVEDLQGGRGGIAAGRQRAADGVPAATGAGHGHAHGGRQAVVDDPGHVQPVATDGQCRLARTVLRSGRHDVCGPVRRGSLTGDHDPRRRATTRLARVGEHDVAANRRRLHVADRAPVVDRRQRLPLVPGIPGQPGDAQPGRVGLGTGLGPRRDQRRAVVGQRRRPGSHRRHRVQRRVGRLRPVGARAGGQRPEHQHCGDDHGSRSGHATTVRLSPGPPHRATDPSETPDPQRVLGKFPSRADGARHTVLSRPRCSVQAHGADDAAVVGRPEPGRRALARVVAGDRRLDGRQARLGKHVDRRCG